jgi:cytoskeletal protein CcmA (bactofilin family)
MTKKKTRHKKTSSKKKTKKKIIKKVSKKLASQNKKVVKKSKIAKTKRVKPKLKKASSFTRKKTRKLPLEKNNQNTPVYSKKDLLIPVGTAVSGSIIAKNCVVIEGEFHGKISCKTLEIKKNGLCTGQANVMNAYILGRVNMNLNVSQKIKLGKHSSIDGYIFYNKNIDIEKGAIVHAKLTPKEGLLMLSYDRPKNTKHSTVNDKYDLSGGELNEVPNEKTTTPNIKKNLNPFYSVQSQESGYNPQYQPTFTDPSKPNKESSFDKIIKSIFSK